MWGYLRGRQQAYTGRPASAMYYDEAKGRYVIDGESESDDEPVPPPPPVTSKPKQPVVQEGKNKDDEPKGGLAGLIAAPMNPALSAAKKKGGRKPGGPRFASTFGNDMISDSKYIPEPIKDEKPKEPKESPAQGEESPKMTGPNKSSP